MVGEDRSTCTRSDFGLLASHTQGIDCLTTTGFKLACTNLHINYTVLVMISMRSALTLFFVFPDDLKFADLETQALTLARKMSQLLEGIAFLALNACKTEISP